MKTKKLQHKIPCAKDVFRRAVASIPIAAIFIGLYVFMVTKADEAYFYAEVASTYPLRGNYGLEAPATSGDLVLRGMALQRIRSDLNIML